MVFTEDHFVPQTSPNAKLGRKHRALVREHITRTRHRKYLQVGKPGLMHLSWRFGPAPGKVRRPNEAPAETQSSEVETTSQLRLQLHFGPTRLSDSGMLSGNAHDPFGSLPIAKNGSNDPARTLCQLFRGWSPVIEYESGARPGDVQHPLLNKLLPVAVQNADLLGAILTDGQYWCDVTLAPTPAPGLHSVLYYRGQTMSHIRMQLLTNRAQESYIGDATILAIAFLMGVDSYNSDFVSEATHERALKVIISSRGGLDSLDPFVRSLLLTYNFWFQQSRPPLFQREEYASDIQRLERLRTVTLLQAQQATPYLPNTFGRLLQCRPMSLQLLDILMRTQSWSATLQRLWSRQAAITDYTTFSECEAFLILDDVLLLRSKMRKELRDHDQEDTPGSRLEMLVILTLILYLPNTMYKPTAQNWSIYQQPLNEVTEMLQDWFGRKDQLLRLEVPLRNAFIWCSVIAVDSWRRTNHVIDPKGMTIIVSLIDSFAELQEWSVLKRVLQESLWYGAAMKDWRICWEAGQRDLMERRRRCWFTGT